MVACWDIRLSKNTALIEPAEGGGFEPPRPLRVSALAARRLEPLGQPSGISSAEGEGFEPPRLSPPVFETGALPVRLTLRCWSQVVSHHWMTSCTSGLVDPGGTRTLISWVQTRGPTGWTTDPSCQNSVAGRIQTFIFSLRRAALFSVELPQRS